MVRTIFIGDVHGCINELKELVDTLNVSGRDRVILLGDLINRGPAPAETVRYVFDRGFECVMGNHDHHYKEGWEKKEPYKNLRLNLGDLVHDWFVNLPLYIETEDFIAVHAGLHPSLPPAETEPRILFRIRTWDGIGEDLSSPENPSWYDLYRGVKKVFYGHWAKQGFYIRGSTYGLDSGCVYGKKLSAYLLEEDRLIQVSARRAYAPIDP